MSIRTLIIDDSPTMRGLIRLTLSGAPDIEVVGEAADAIEARAAIKALRPDVVTLDVEMPNMNGLDFLEKIMRLRPTPVVMCSTMTHRGAETALRALEIGAVDCVGKPLGAVGNFDGLVEKVRAAAQARLRSPMEERTAPSPRPFEFIPNNMIVAMGSSTGGVEALIQILSSFPANCPPTVMTQHMPGTFTRTFAARLNHLCAATVEEARDGVPLEPGRIYLAPGGDNHLCVEKGLVNGRSKIRCRLRPGPTRNGHRPSVDILFESIAAMVGPAAIGVILTGMGRDGAEGLLAMRKAGARTLGQDESSSIVYGMPKVAFELGAVERQAPIFRIANQILTLAKARSSSGV